MIVIVTLTQRQPTRLVREKLNTGSYTNLRTISMESERLEPLLSGNPFTLVVSTFHPGSYYTGDAANASAENDLNFTLSCYCDDMDGFQVEEIPYD